MGNLQHAAVVGLAMCGMETIKRDCIGCTKMDQVLHVIILACGINGLPENGAKSSCRNSNRKRSAPHELGNRKEKSRILSHITYKKVTKRHPQFIEQLHERGLSIRVADGVDDPSAFTCSSWKSTVAHFMTERVLGPLATHVGESRPTRREVCKKG